MGYKIIFKNNLSLDSIQDKKFLNKIQQLKMKELWDNKEDEVWENEKILFSVSKEKRDLIRKELFEKIK